MGDLFEVDGELLTVFKIRIAVTGEEVRTLVHYSFQGRARIAPAVEVCGWLGDGLSTGRIRSLDRAADFTHIAPDLPG